MRWLQRTRDRRAAGGVGRREVFDHRLAKPRLEIEHAVGDAEALGDAPRIVDVLAGAAGALPAECRAMVIELSVIPITSQPASTRSAAAHGVDAARHGDDHPALGGRTPELQVLDHGRMVVWFL